MPYNNISADRLSTNKNLYDEYGQALSPTDERYGENLYLTSGTDYQFGMYMEANFIQPKDGIVQQTNESMRFEFNGDDDLWIYIDNVLILDIGGVHDAHSGYIDFATGEVVVYDSVTNGKTITRRTTLYDLFKQANRMPDSTEVVRWDENKVDDYFVKDENGAYTTLKNYSPHKIKMFYMERGSGASNLHMKFNLQVIPEGTIEVSKELLNTDKEKYANVQFAFQVYAQKILSTDSDGNETYSENEYVLLTSDAKNKETGEAIQFQDNVPIGEELYDGVFYLKQGETAQFTGLQNNRKYYVVEIGVNAGEYSEIVINGTTIKSFDKDEQETSVIDNIESGKEAVYERPSILFENSCSVYNRRELQITKKMKEGQTSEDRFSFQVMLESSEGTGLIPYVGTYYLTQIVDGEKIYYHFDSENNLVPYSDNDNEESLVCGSTGQDGIVSNIPVGFTVAITQILSDTDFKVTEIDPNTGLNTPKYGSPTYEVKPGTAGEINNTGGASGIILLGENAEVTVTNRYKPEIVVEKEWEPSSPSDVTEIQVGLYKLNGQEYMPTDQTLKLTSPGWSGKFEGLESGIDYTVKELQEVSNSGDAEFTIGGKYYKGVGEGQSVEIGGSNYSVNYETSSNGQITTITITNSIADEWKIVKKSSSKNSDGTNADVPAGAKFTLTNSKDNICYDGEVLEENQGVISWSRDGVLVENSEIEAGTYVLKEVQAPAGFAISNEEWTLTFAAKGAVPTIMKGESEYTVEPIEENGKKVYTFIFENTPIFDLPSAGSSGIFGYMMGGTLLLMAGTLILYKMKRKEVLGS